MTARQLVLIANKDKRRRFYRQKQVSEPSKMFSGAVEDGSE
jgi:hypothetical protein